MNVAMIEQLPPDVAIATDQQTLESVTSDWWPLSLLHKVRGDEPKLPLAVARPTSTGAVATLLSWASEHNVAVVPRGGGSGVCGGAVPPADSIVLDMRGMDQILNIDEQSRCVHVQAGVLGGALESALNERGLMLGHYTQSFTLSTVGGWIAATSAGQQSPAFGFIEDHLIGLTAVLTDGTIIEMKPTPRSAAGPNLRNLIIGSEGTLAVVTDAWLTFAPLAESIVWDGYRLPSFDACFNAAREIRAAGIHPRINRGWDVAESRHAFEVLGHTDGCVSVVGFTNGEPGVAERRAAARDIFTAWGGIAIGPNSGARWFENRLSAIDKFQEVMGPTRALGDGSMIDTIEIAGLWGNLPKLYVAVRDALLEHAEEARCHFSHVYMSGACLYYTFIVRDTDDYAVEEKYVRLWDTAARACLENGGTLTHHHGMGRLKARFTPEELGSGGTEVLRRVKRALDPNGILNPGALLPE